MKSKVYCSLCGMENYPLLKYCDNCGHVLKTSRIIEETAFETVESFLTLENRNRIIYTKINEEIYDKIINNIRDMGLMNLNLYSNESCLFRVLKLVQQFSKFHYTGDIYGYYSCNSIFLDNTLCDTQKTCFLIHELAHQLYSEIFEQILMYIFNSRKSKLIEAFVSYMIRESYPYLISTKYLAYTIEGHFTGNLMNDYSSIDKILKENNIDDIIVQDMYILGNTISYDIIRILEIFIPKEFQDEIQSLSINDNIQPKPKHELDNVEVIDDVQEKIDKLKDMIVHTFNYFIENPQKKKEISTILEKFKKVEKAI